MQCQDNTKTIYAGFGARLSAYLIDSLLVGIGLLVVRIPMLIAYLFGSSSFITKPILFEFNIFDIVIYLLSILYYTLMTYYSGSTLGKKYLNLKVVSASGEKLTFINVLYRETIGKYLSGVVMFVGYFLIAIDEQKRGLHDILCDTRVIYNFKVPVKVVERAPGKKYAWTWSVKEEFMNDFLELHLKPSEEILQEQRKAGYKNSSFFNNGNQFFFVFECDNIEYANNYLSSSQVCRQWYESISPMVESSFNLKNGLAV
ncbi:MAG TPA: RDD family protein [Acetivibrio sp.]|uniref:RDD family protein n=1 Tax=Acetivibrio sp. TaxID=1872092 RepID=UPI002C74A76E|nr:RDD family protein [Acetivibrio sp.]HOM02940.1 RDD family protein [Acetivibrio sp.]